MWLTVLGQQNSILGLPGLHSLLSANCPNLDTLSSLASNLAPLDLHVNQTDYI